MIGAIVILLGCGALIAVWFAVMCLVAFAERHREKKESDAREGLVCKAVALLEETQKGGG